MCGICFGKQELPTGEANEVVHMQDGMQSAALIAKRELAMSTSYQSMDAYSSTSAY